MNEQDARDPFLGLNEHIRTQAREQLPPQYILGTVLSLLPLTVRADGMDLDRDDLKIAQHLLPGWTERLTGLSWPLTAQLPVRRFVGECAIEVMGAVITGTAWVDRPAETVAGKTAETAPAAHASPLSVGDTVLLIRSEDGQVYFMIEKLVPV